MVGAAHYNLLSAIRMYHVSTVPNSPPQNVNVVSVLPGSFNISWQPPPDIDQNGPIVGYVIRYAMNESDGVIGENSTSMFGSGDLINEATTSGTTYLLAELFAFVSYSVQIAAMTVNGTGPFSAPVSESSGLEGM